MKTRKLGQTDIEVAAIGYGCMGQTHSYGVVEREDDMVALMRYAHEVGYTMFDTAPIYGEDNERYLGKAVAPFRQDVVIMIIAWRNQSILRLVSLPNDTFGGK